jgi:uncharacterized protein
MSIPIGRRAVLGMAASLPFAAHATEALRLHAGAPGGTFLPYAQGLARFLDEAGAGPVTALESAGSNANLIAVDADPNALGLALHPALRDAVRGEGFSTGLPLRNVRALFATYRTTYQLVARPGGPARVLDLDGKRVGVGAAGGADAALFQTLVRELFVRAIPVTGTAAQLAEALAEGRIDALWVGALSPIPAIAELTARIDARVFGLTAWEIARLVDRNDLLAPTLVPAGTYRGQSVAIATVASWNLLVAHKDLPEARALRIAQAVHATPDAAARIHATAAGARAADTAAIRGIPFHPGAARFFREAGYALR